MSDYHDMVMRALTAYSDELTIETSPMLAYQMGHRDARHAAAEIAAEADVVIDDLYDALENVRAALDNHIVPSKLISDVELALSKARGEQP